MFLFSYIKVHFTDLLFSGSLSKALTPFSILIIFSCFQCFRISSVFSRLNASSFLHLLPWLLINVFCYPRESLAFLLVPHLFFGSRIFSTSVAFLTGFYLSECILKKYILKICK